MRISDWSSDVCSSDLVALALGGEEGLENLVEDVGRNPGAVVGDRQHDVVARHDVEVQGGIVGIELLVHRLAGELSALRRGIARVDREIGEGGLELKRVRQDGPEVGREHHGNFELLTERRTEEHTSELQSLMRISYAVFCLK